MAIRTRVESLDRDVALIISQDLSPAAASAAFAAAARTILDDTDAREMAALGRVPPSVTYVDGHAGAALETVKPSGIIVREYQLALDALDVIRAELQNISPRITGRYRDSHTLFADGIVVAAGAPIPVAEKYVFASTAPYARRLERLYDVYLQVGRAMSRKFGNQIKINFGWQSVNGGDLSKWASATKMSHRGHASLVSRQSWLTHQPALTVTVR